MPSTSTMKIYSNEICRMFDKSFSNKKKQNSFCGWEKWFIRMFSIGYYLLCIPIRFDIKSGKFWKCSSTLVLGLWLLRVLWLILDTTYLLSQILSITQASVGSEEFLSFYTHTLTRWVATVTAILLAVDKDGIVVVINVLFKSRCVWKGGLLFE